MFIQTILVAALALVVGLAFCFAGFRLFIILLPIWAFFAGLISTAQAIQELFGGGFLATVSGWVFGLVGGLLFAVAAYFFYYAAVVILALLVGFEAGAGLMIGFGVNSGFLQFLVGLAVGAVLGIAVVFLNLPKAFIVVLAAFAGAQMILAGVLLALGRIGLPELRWGLVGAYIHSSWFWGLAYLAIAGFGIVVQLLLPDAYVIAPYGQGLDSFQAPVASNPADLSRTVTDSSPTYSGPAAPAAQ